MNLSRIKRVKNKVPILTFPIKLDLGCGDDTHKKKGYVGLDINDYGQEIVWDLEMGLPLPDNSCSNINASQVFEHVEDFVSLMNECHRVLVPEGELALDVPHRENTKAYLPSHINKFDAHSFDFFQYEDYAKEYGGSIWKVTHIAVEKNFIIFVRMIPIK